MTGKAVFYAMKANLVRVQVFKEMKEGKLKGRVVLDLQ